MQIAVERRGIHPALPHRDAAIHSVATGVAPPLPVDLRVVDPALLPGGTVQRVDASKIAHRIQHTIDDDRRRFQPAASTQFVVPGKAEPRHGLGIDAGQGGMIRALGITPGGEPLAGLMSGIAETCRVDPPCRLRRSGGQRCQNAGGNCRGRHPSQVQISAFSHVSLEQPREPTPERSVNPAPASGPRMPESRAGGRQSTDKARAGRPTSRRPARDGKHPATPRREGLVRESRGMILRENSAPATSPPLMRTSRYA